MTSTLPQGTRATHFEDYEIEDRHYKVWKDVTECINRLGKFQNIG